MLRKVRDLINQRKLFQIPQIESGSTVETALIKLNIFNSSALLVMKSGKLLGIFTERDFARASIRKDIFLKLDTRVDELMSDKVVFVTDSYRLDECMAIMAKMKIRHLPVLQDGIPIAILSMRNILEALVEDKEFMISELTKYVTGSYYMSTENYASARNNIPVHPARSA